MRIIDVDKVVTLLVDETVVDHVVSEENELGPVVKIVVEVDKVVEVINGVIVDGSIEFK